MYALCAPDLSLRRCYVRIIQMCDLAFIDRSVRLGLKRMGNVNILPADDKM